MPFGQDKAWETIPKLPVLCDRLLVKSSVTLDQLLSVHQRTCNHAELGHGRIHFCCSAKFAFSQAACVARIWAARSVGDINICDFKYRIYLHTHAHRFDWCFRINVRIWAGLLRLCFPCPQRSQQVFCVQEHDEVQCTCGQTKGTERHYLRFCSI